jgi:ABC-type sugar transport system substrate-binding protein
MNRRRFLRSSAALGALTLASPAAFAQEELTILGSVPSLGFPFFVHMLNQIKVEAEAEGVTLIESDGQNSAPKQTADVEAALVQGVGAIVISPLDVNALAPAIEQAVAAGVPVVTIDRRVDGVEGILAHVGADNVLGGEAEAQAVVDAFPDGATIFHLQGQPGAGPPSTATRASTTSSTPGRQVPIVFEQTANFARAEALSVTEAGLAANGKPDAIICANDDMALGAIEACAARGFTDVKIYGFDALPEALVAVRDGTLAGTVEQFPASSRARRSASRWPSRGRHGARRGASCSSPPSSSAPTTSTRPSASARRRRPPGPTDDDRAGAPETSGPGPPRGRPRRRGERP